MEQQSNIPLTSLYYLPAKPNFELGLGTPTKGAYPISFSYRVKRTLPNRFKYWLLCKLLPFTIARWDRLEEDYD